MIASDGAVVVALCSPERRLKLWRMDTAVVPTTAAAAVGLNIDHLEGAECMEIEVAGVDVGRIQCLTLSASHEEEVIIATAEGSVVMLLRVPHPRDCDEEVRLVNGEHLCDVGEPVIGMQFSKNARALLAYTCRHLWFISVSPYAAQRRKVVLELPGAGSIMAACFLQEGDDSPPRLSIADDEGMLHIWEVHGGELASSLTLDLSQDLGAHETLCHICPHPTTRWRLAVISARGRVWVCGYRSDLISAIASTSLARETQQPEEARECKDHEQSCSNVLDAAWTTRGLVVITADASVVLDPTHLSLLRLTRHSNVLIEGIASFATSAAVTISASRGMLVVTYRATSGQSQLRVHALLCSESPTEEQLQAHSSQAATPIRSLFLQPEHDTSAKSVMSVVMQHRRRKAPTAEQKQQLRQLSWDTFDRKSASQAKKAQQKPVDMPITFHNRIKSSGYGQAKPPAKTSTKSRSSLSKASSEAKKTKAICASSYELGELPNSHQAVNNLTEPAPIRFVKFNGNASMCALGSAGGEYSIRCVKLPVRRYGGDGVSLVGHQARVNDIDFSHDNALLLSVSDDKSARLWKVTRGNGELCTVLRHQKRSPRLDTADALVSGSGAAGGDSANPLFNSELLAGKFYGMDQLVCCASGASVFMYAYEISSAAHADISKYKSRFQVNYRLIHAWAAAGQQITTLGCWNNTYSPYLVAGSTNRSVQIFDTVAMRTVHVYEECHSKAISHVALPMPSQAAQVPQDKYTLFATCAADSAVKLWDVRTDGPVATLAEHTNNRESLTCDVSPCLTFVAVGSEDGKAYVYDIRSMRSVSVLRGHRDVVSSCVFNPVRPQLATASYDCGVRFYSAQPSARANAESAR